MKLLSAVLDRTDLHLAIWLDETRTIDDPTWVRPMVDGLAEQEDGTFKPAQMPDMSIPHPQVFDPDWVLTSTWGGADKEGAIDSAIREATLLAEDELRRRTPVAERAKDEARPETVDLIAEPIDISEARTEVAKAVAKVGRKVA